MKKVKRPVVFIDPHDNEHYWTQSENLVAKINIVSELWYCFECNKDERIPCSHIRSIKKKEKEKQTTLKV